MESEQVRAVTGVESNRQRRIVHLRPLFFALLAIVFITDLFFYKLLNIVEIHQVIVSQPTRGNPIKITVRLNDSMDIPSDINLKGQSEKERRITNQLSSSPVTTPRIKTQLKLWEQPILLNLNFSWLSNNKAICKPNANDSKALHLLSILVHSAPSHFSERLVIRRSWGSLRKYKDWDVRVVFLLGEADLGIKPERNDEELNLTRKTFEEQDRRLQSEQNGFGDLVIGSFIDSYHNLTYKHLMGYKWILNYCRDATLVMKVDDDTFIETMRWLDWRSDDLDKIANNKSAPIPDLYCNTYQSTKPIRRMRSKWYVSPEDWPDPDYPDYCLGCAYAITVDLIQKIYISSSDRKMFWVDDVFVTGALMEVAKGKFDFKLEVKHIWREVTFEAKRYSRMCKEGRYEKGRKFGAVCNVPRGKLYERDMTCMWNRTLLDRDVANTLIQLNNWSRN